MHTQKWLLVFLNLFGGSAVLGSYAHGILTHPNAAQILWGGVPQEIRPFYNVGMFLAAAGYFAFTYLILFRLDPQATRVADRFSFRLFNALYAVILIPSALWMPLTFLAAEQSSQVLAWAVRIVLALVAAASLGLLAALLKVELPQPRWAHRLALAGVVAFCIQTVLLDAIYWGVNFQV